MSAQDSLKREQVKAKVRINVHRSSAIDVRHVAAARLRRAILEASSIDLTSLKRDAQASFGRS
jgi:hypothetical protein